MKMGIVLGVLTVLIYFPIFLFMLNKRFKRKFGRINSEKKQDLLIEAILGILYFFIIFFSLFEDFKSGYIFIFGALVYFGSLILTYLGYFIFYKSRGLITNNVFSVSRNPTYFFGILSVFGIVLMTFSLKILFLLILIFVLTNHVVSNEEKYLKKKFGKKYFKYEKRVRRWI